MPPKKAHSIDSFSVSSTSSRIRSHVAADLITKSEAALSSQASVYTQRTNASQQGNINFVMNENEDLQFNRQEIAQVFITRQQQQVIQKILQLARKGKVNSKNAFEIPIKVVNSEVNTTINNKFWKFASELLDASMYIYDKRVQNMYVSIGAFQNKLSRIGFNIKDKKALEEDRLDDANAQQEMRGDRNREERQKMLKISADDFSGALNLDDSEIIGFQTIEKKDKIDIKNIENKFIADPTFQKTQKLFDSFSLKSLMLNIFNLSPNLNVGLFYKSDLQQNTIDFYQQSNKVFVNEQNSKKHRSASDGSKNNQLQILKEINQDHAQSQRTQSVKDVLNHAQSKTDSNNNKAFMDFGDTSLSYEMQKHLIVTKSILKQKPLLEEITNFISKQPQLKQDFLQRQKTKPINNNNNIKSTQQIHFNNEANQSQNQFNPDITYGQIIEKELIEFIDLFKEFHQNMEQEFVNHRQGNDLDNHLPLFETHETQSQQFQLSQNNYSNPFNNNNSGQIQDYLETNSMPVSHYEESFFSWDQQNNIIQPIMPWEIEFKNLKLTKKRKQPQKGQSKRSKKSNKKSLEQQIEFDLKILDRFEVLKQKDVKKKFLSSKSPKIRFHELNCQPKQFDIVHGQYHTKQSKNFQSNLTGIAQRQSFKKQVYFSQSQPNSDNHPSFVFDLDDSVNPNYSNVKKEEQHGPSEEQTRLYDGQSYSNFQQGSGNFFQSTDTNSRGQFSFGYNMGVNNIREIKKIIVNQVNEKGSTSLEEMNRLMSVLSPQQLFTIFLHLTNEHQFQISNQDEDQSTVILSQTKRKHIQNGQKNRYEQIQI